MPGKHSDSDEAVIFFLVQHPFCFADLLNYIDQRKHFSESFIQSYVVFRIGIQNNILNFLTLDARI